MKFKLVVRPEVDADLLEAERWYEQQQAGLGRDFLRQRAKQWRACRAIRSSTEFASIAGKCAGLIPAAFHTESFSGWLAIP